MQTSPKQHLSFREKLAYGLGDTASNFFFQVFNLFLLYYYTDIVGLPAAAVGTMFFITRIIDAVKNPIMGLIADRTRSRWGKFRPYLLFGAIPFGLAGYLVFLNPQFGPTGKLVYAYCSFMLVTLAYAAINIPYSALMGVMSPSSAERTSLSSIRFVCAFGGGLAISSLVIPLKNALGHGDDALGFKLTMALFAAASVALFLFPFVSTKERVSPPPGQDSSLRADLKALLSNRPWVVLFFVAIASLAQVAIRNACAIYFFKYYVGSESRAALYLTSGMLALIAGTACTKLFLKLTSRKKLLIILSTTSALRAVPFFFLPPTAFGWMLALNILGGFLGGPVPAIVWSLYADTADYGEWLFGRRTTALIFAASNFANNLGLAFGGALGGWLLDAFGFVPNVVQTTQTLLGIRLMFTLIPAGFSLLGVIGILFYPLDDEQVCCVERDLAARKGMEPIAVQA